MRQQHGKEQDVRFEPADVPAFLPLWLAAGLASFVIIVLVGITIGYPLADEQQYRGPMQALPPAPRLQLTPGQDLEAYQAAKRREFQGSNSAIEAAMHSTAKQGWGPPR
ncbi:MAG TPA: hypothetical protein VFR92_07560 [Sphingomicrobium sp.]|nr:hypothetical protein [Sphingomicrobium sp.]